MSMDENELARRYWVNRRAEEKARRAMVVVVVAVVALVLACALAGPLLYTLVCQARGC